MSISMYQVTVPVFVHMLKALDRVIDKAEAYAAAKNIDPQALLGARLYPDMFPMLRQVLLACDFAKGAGARLAGVEVPSYPDDEKTFAELKARIAKTVAFLETLKPEQFDGAETREVTLKVAGQPMTFDGLQYLNYFVLPNFYFHQAIAFGLLRHNGIEIGKRDFVGRA